MTPRPMRAFAIALAGSCLAALGALAHAAGERAAVVNPGFESTKPGARGDPEGWTGIQHAGPLSYTFKLDTAVHHDGERSLRIDNVGPEPYGAVFQQLRADALRGKTVRLSAWMRTRDTGESVTGAGAVLTLQAMQGGATIAWNHMKDAPVRGTTDWARHEITLAIPRNADQVEVGAMLHGRGTLWLDDVEVTAE